MKCLYLLTRKGKLEANRLLQIFLMDFRDLMAWMTDLAMRISSGEPAKNVKEAEALLELHTERKVPYQREQCYEVVRAPAFEMRRSLVPALTTKLELFLDRP